MGPVGSFPSTSKTPSSAVGRRAQLGHALRFCDLDLPPPSIPAQGPLLPGSVTEIRALVSLRLEA